LVVVVTAFCAWLGGRLDDAGHWAVNLVRDLPVRIGRLAVTLWAGLRGLVTFIPESWRRLTGPTSTGVSALAAAVGLRLAGWLLTFLARLADLVGLPELVEFVVRAVSVATPLTAEEVATAGSVLGLYAVRWEDVRVAEGGLLRLIFARNNGRAFTIFHTIAMPPSGYSRRANLPILVHELVHIYQHTRCGCTYIWEALRAQATEGYAYGDAEGLHLAFAAGKHFRDFNREQQAQIVEDYFRRLQADEDVRDYGPFIAELRAGEV
jgi:hypothetical protein